MEQSTFMSGLMENKHKDLFYIIDYLTFTKTRTCVFPFNPCIGYAERCFRVLTQLLRQPLFFMFKGLIDKNEANAKKHRNH